MLKQYIMGALLMLAANGLQAQGTISGNVVNGNLQVNGALTATGGASFGGPTEGNLTLTSQGGLGWVWHPSVNRNLYLMPGWDGSKQVVFQSNGNVSFSQRVTIGDVISPGTLGINNLSLAVGGRIGARAMHVVAPTSPWPDYVFAPSYRLMPLAEVA